MRVLKFLIEMIKPHRIYLFGMLLANLLIAIDANLQPFLVKLLMDDITDSNSSNSHNMMLLLIVFGVTQILKILAWTFSDYCSMRFNPHFRIRIVTSIAQKISAHSYSFFQENLSGTIVAKANDLFNLSTNIIHTINHQFINFFLTTTITLSLLYKIHAYFALGLLVWMIIFMIIIMLAYKRNILLLKSYAESKAAIWGVVSDYITNMLGVKLFAASTHEIKYINHKAQNFVEKNDLFAKFQMYFYTIQGLVTGVYFIGLILLLTNLKNSYLISAGDFLLVFILNSRAINCLDNLSHTLRNLAIEWGNVDQALITLDVLPDIVETEKTSILKVTYGEIAFREVEFCYKNSTAPLFINKSITICQGQKVGLVGYSGGGKSTFINLILRLYETSAGQILIDNQDIKHITQDSLRNSIAMIPQDISLFHRSLMENIRYGKLSATDEEVIAASIAAHAHEFIIKLPEQYNSAVGERGIKLSGGQRQRISIARAILKNAPILILDEATSQLDSLTENIIQQSLWQLMENKTVLVVAHRLSTLLNMDRILVFDKGKIIQDGTHNQLLDAKGLYKTLWNTQVNGFLSDEIA
ncbi:MAG: ABC transporter ATP-binding protein [Rickettsiaceae bacterium]|nr:MAG: ABC transporter ATP-binding protein [Rickettsiaceae bacterium]